MKTLFTLLALTLFVASGTLAQTQNRNDDSSMPSHNMESKNTGVPLKIQSMVPSLIFDEHPYNHNMHITSDGNYFYTINGGNSSVGQINKFDLAGTFIETDTILIDGRGLSYNYADSFLYASLYGGDVVKINDLSLGTYSVLFPTAMQDGQASFAISVDGTKFYDFYNGTLLVHDFVTGSVINTITGLFYGTGNFGGDAAVAVDSTHIYTWDATIKTVYVYDTAGTFIQTMVLDSGDNGHSLAVAKNYLFVSRDGNYNIGTWYGYELYPAPNSISEVENNYNLNVYPNPTTGKVLIKNNIPVVTEVYNYLGEKIYLPCIKKQTSSEIDFLDSPKGIYFLKINDGKNVFARKIVVQ